MLNEARKSLYIFLSGLLGMLMFLALHRLAVFIFLGLLNLDPTSFGFGLSYLELLALDYLTLFIALLLGLWYGIWLGLYWYEMVYVLGEHKGFVDHLVSTYWMNKPLANEPQTRVEQVAENVEREILSLEETVGYMPPKISAARPAPGVRNKKRPAKKVKG